MRFETTIACYLPLTIGEVVIVEDLDCQVTASWDADSECIVVERVDVESQRDNRWLVLTAKSEGDAAMLWRVLSEAAYRDDVFAADFHDQRREAGRVGRFAA